MKQISRRKHFCFGKKSESASDKLHSALYTFNVAGSSHIKCTLYSSAHCAYFSL